MNLLILSPGRRVDIVQYFKKDLSKIGGRVYTADMSPYAPALYEGEKFFLLEKNFDALDKYIDDIIKICVENEVSYILTLIDPELVLLAENKEKFERSNITPIVSSKRLVDLTFDKYKFYQEFKNKLPLLPTYDNVKDVKIEVKKGTISYPIFAKINTGSGSAGIGKINNEKELDTYVGKDNYIFQPCVLEREYGCDIYFDMISKKIVSYFIKYKLNMRSGETDKAISVKNSKIEDIIKKLDSLDFLGPIDMDIFEDKDGNFYVNEINPRFGGGYPHAYNSGVNFMEKICNNIIGKANGEDFGAYKENLVMMKYNGTLFVAKDELAK